MARQSFNAGTAPSGIGGDTNKTINTKWEANFTELYKAMGAVFGGVNSGAPGAVLPTALPIANGGTGATTQVAAAKALLPAAATGQFLKYDGKNWIASADNNTTYSNMSTAEITAGTGTTGRLITPKDLKTAVGTYNAASATKLQTPRKINGIDFDGTQDINFATLPLGVPLFHGGTRATIETGYVPYDGQLLNRADYPAMWDKVQATFSIITDADWLANPSKRGSYSSGDGTTTFRMPDYNGVQTDSLKGLFLRGDGGGTIGELSVVPGNVLNDAIRNINGIFDVSAYNDAVSSRILTDASNNLFKSYAAYGQQRAGLVFSGTAYSSQVHFDASKVVPTAAENRPVSAVGIWICRVGNATTEVANPTLHAVLTGGNTFAGTQKMDAVQFNDLTILRGLVSSMATGGTDKAVTAEAIKAFYNLFSGSYTGSNITFQVPNVNDISKPMLIQMGSVAGIVTANTDVVITFPRAFPNSAPFVMACNGDMIASSGAIIGVSQYIAKTAFAARSNVSGAQRINYIAIGN